jgi:hypothetical protein
MKDYQPESKHWFSKYGEDITITSQKPKVKIVRKSISVIIIGLVFLSLFSNPGTAAHTVSYYDSFDKAKNIADEFMGQNSIDKSLFDASEMYSYNTGAAIRCKTSFAELSSGCVAETEWLLPLEEGRPIVPMRNYESEESIIEDYKEGTPRNEGESDYDYANRLIDKEVSKVNFPTNINWYSYPPVRGNYVSEDWEGARIIKDLKKDERPMRFEEGLRLLYQGNYIIWYHPSLLEESFYEFSALDEYVFEKILSEEEGSPRIYLVTLLGSNLEKYPRKIYLSKLNYTQSCTGFNKDIIDKFYSYN